MSMKKEIVFGPSAAGNLKVAQFTGIGKYPKAWREGIYDKNGNLSEVIEEHTKNEIEKWNNSRPIGGCSEDIICFELSLEHGDISEAVPANKRYASIKKMIETMYPKERYGTISEEWIRDVRKNNDEALRELKKAIDSRTQIRIWYSSAPDEINGFYWLMSYLDKLEVYENISAIFLPPKYWTGHGFSNAWGQLDSGKWYETLNLEGSIAEEQIKRYAERWKELQAENSNLRMMVSGNLLSLQEDFLDYYFMNALLYIIVQNRFLNHTHSFSHRKKIVFEISFRLFAVRSSGKSSSYSA